MPVSTDVTKLVGDLAEMLLRTLGATIDLNIKTGTDLWFATIDPNQFENALLNLAINARDAMQQGGTLTIETNNTTLDEAYSEHHEEVAPGDYVTVCVADTGCGISPQVLEKVFEPFFTTKDVGEGSGLGLSMVYGFAKQSGGHITIASEVDLGTTVTLFLPRSQETIAQNNTEEVIPEIALGAERILVVEDDEYLRELPVTFLRNQGYEVVEVADGESAIKVLMDDHRFDLLFTDVVLAGGMNGIEIAEKAITLQPGIKILYTTGYSEDSIKHHGSLDAGEILNKPYVRAELLGTIRAVLDSKND